MIKLFFFNYFFFDNLLFRSLLSLCFTFFIFIKLINFFLKFFEKNRIYQFVRYNISNNHLLKIDIPTMGGLVIFCSVLISSLLFIFYLNIYLFLLFFFVFMSTIIGFIDDYVKIFYCSYNGLSIFKKFFLQSVIVIIFIYLYCSNNSIMLNQVNIPILNRNINIGFFYPILLYFMIIGIINSVNFTDGLDGLVVLPVILIVIYCLIISLISGNLYLVKIFNVPYLYYSNELVILNLIVLSSLIGFLPFNFYPARIFLGDVGSLFLGSFISVMFILLHRELYFLIVGFLFVVEIYSVVVQILYFKFFHKRFFLMAPIHHHYELKGFKEIRIVSWFWVISFFSFLVSLLILGFM